jgi:hypothetical protein
MLAEGTGRRRQEETPVQNRLAARTRTPATNAGFSRHGILPADVPVAVAHLAELSWPVGRANLAVTTLQAQRRSRGGLEFACGGESRHHGDMKKT